VAKKSVSQLLAEAISSTDRVPSADLLTNIAYQQLISKDILVNKFDLI